MINDQALVNGVFAYLITIQIEYIDPLGHKCRHSPNPVIQPQNLKEKKQPNSEAPMKHHHILQILWFFQQPVVPAPFC